MILFTSVGKMEWEMDRRIGAATAVMQALYQIILVCVLNAEYNNITLIM